MNRFFLLSALIALASPFALAQEFPDPSPEELKAVEEFRKMQEDFRARIAAIKTVDVYDCKYGKRPILGTRASKVGLKITKKGASPFACIAHEVCEPKPGKDEIMGDKVGVVLLPYDSFVACLPDKKGKCSKSHDECLADNDITYDKDEDQARHAIMKRLGFGNSADGRAQAGMAR